MTVCADYNMFNAKVSRQDWSLFLWGVIINTQMSEHTAGTACHNNERILSNGGISLRKKMTVLYCVVSESVKSERKLAVS